TRRPTRARCADRRIRRVLVRGADSAAARARAGGSRRGNRRERARTGRTPPRASSRHRRAAARGVEEARHERPRDGGGRGRSAHVDELRDVRCAARGRARAGRGDGDRSHARRLGPRAQPSKRWRQMKRSPARTLFVIELVYKAALTEIDAYMSAHMAFLNKYYASGHFLVSGRKIPREGGIILAVGSSREDIEAIAREDPFYVHGLADVRVVQFRASQRADDIQKRIDG